MPMKTKSYKDFKYGTINAIEPSELPEEAIYKSQNMYYKENFWRKVPGLVEINTTAIDTNKVLAISKFHQIAPKKSYILCYSGSSVYYLDNTNTFVSIISTLNQNSRMSFIEYRNSIYFGSPTDQWRRFDGGTISYTVGGANGQASDAPRKFAQILFNPYAGRFFAIGELTNPDYLYFSEHIDDEGIEKWPAGNIQIIDSVNGDVPKYIDIYEGRIYIVSEHSINTGTVLGVPESWNFQREKSTTGTIATNTVKRFGNSFFMLTPELEVYRWPEDKFINKGRVKFDINPTNAHLACAEIVEDRYYVLCFESSQAVSSDKYHWWVYDILGDRWYGPSIQRNVVSMCYDHDNKILLCGGVDDLAGFVMEYRGRDIKNQAMKCHVVGSYSDYGDPKIEKRYVKGYLKAKQEGSLPNGSGQVELIINTDYRYNNPMVQRILLEDPLNLNLAGTGQVREAVTKRFHIHDEYGRGNAIQWEIKHEVRAGDFSFSEIQIEYFIKRYLKENRSV